MRFFYIFFLLFFLSTELSFSQNKFLFSSRSFRRERHRIFLSVGATNFLGDLGGANRIGSPPGSLRDFDVQAIKPAFQIGYSYRMSRIFSSRTAFTYAWLSGNDAYTKEPYRQNRNLNFRTPIYDLSSVIEILWEIKRKGHQYYLKGVRGWTNYRFTTYIYGGVALNYFRSKGKSIVDNKWYALRPLSTEGQGLIATRKKYSPIQFTIPLGVGCKVRVSRVLEIGIEYTARIGFTDYIDDVSTTYFDENALLQEKGQIAVDMANQSLTKDAPDNQTMSWRTTAPGQQRGDYKDKDSYLAVMVSMYYTIGKSFIPRLRNVHKLKRRYP
jgi:hypothetical protein